MPTFINCAIYVFTPNQEQMICRALHKLMRNNWVFIFTQHNKFNVLLMEKLGWED